MEVDLSDMNVEFQNDGDHNNNMNYSFNQAELDVVSGGVTSNIKNETTNYNDAFVSPQFTNIKTYLYSESSPSKELTIFDFENIRTPPTSRNKYVSTDSPVISQSCINCLKNIKNCIIVFTKRKIRL